MKKLYSANNLIEAQMIVALLEHAYIPAKLFNTHAQGGVGEIPFTHAYPEVWIMHDDDLEKARSIIDTYESAPVEEGHVSCPACGEQNPRNFQLCWQCGEGLEVVHAKLDSTYD
ncbi:DUF2007 domain-containing protein [Nitrosomonas communis]|uniref:putative signal transducing protein n=1 Tax=Nitrosomonas communis TaxID=44574 RepID=UPI0026ED42A7|nr:DUF2007 domain-containing protein [Nitrosomonas communis]MCO6428141.1 DUF2007 domain-containing protein [Nitrosomonas communis]